MSAEAAAPVRAFKVGHYECTLTFPPIERGAVKSFVVEWLPEVPRRLSAQEMRQYRHGRDRAIAELAALIGGKVLLLE